MLMKRITILICTLLLPFAMMAAGVKTSRVNAVISEIKGYEGVELVRLGPLSTFALKAVARISTAGDYDAKQALAMLNGVKRLTILDYADCSEKIRSEISGRLDKALKGADLLIETKDGNDVMKMYGVVDEKKGIISDFVVYTPGDCALICIFGKVTMSSVEKMLEQQ